nr:uncharacterized protein LOC106687717 [Halyomorpha halys]
MMSKGDVLTNFQTPLPSKNVLHVYYVGGKKYRSATKALQRYIHLWEKEHRTLAETEASNEKDPELVYLVRALLRLLCASRIRRYIIATKIIYKSKKKIEKMLQEIC